MFGAQLPIGPRATVKGDSGTEPYSLEELSQQNRSTPNAPSTGDEGPPGGSPSGSLAASQAVYVFELDTGLRPWKVMFGCFCLTVSVYGLLSSIGLFQTYWHAHQLAENTESEISWITSIFGFLDCFAGVLAGSLFDRFGLQCLLPLTSVVYVASFIGLAFSTTYGQLMGCFIVAGISAATPTTIAFSIVSQWFSTQEGIATGCVTVGAAVGGIVFSLLLQMLFDKFPWQTAILALSGILFALMLLGNLLVETNLIRKPPAEGWHRSVLLDLLKSPKFWLVTYAVFAYELVLFIQWGSIPTYAVSVGMGDSQFYLMMSYDIGAMIGRTVPLWLSDRKLGPINTIILMNVFTLLTVLVVWLPFGALTVPALFVVVLLMGIGTGSFVPLGVACASELCEPRTTGTFLGSVYTVASFATLIGNPSTGAMLSRYGSQGLVAFIAIILLSGLMSATALRWVCHGKRWIMRDKI